MKKVIELQNIRRNFQVGDEIVHALRGISFTIYEGEFVTIMGTSGSGKSTLLNTLGCLDTPTSGEYFLDGISVRTMSKSARAILRNRKIGFVFQNYNLLPKTTAVENVELPLMYNPDINSAERKKRAIKALQDVGLGNRLEHKSNQMSGGQMQRVAIARALVNNPAVILADEATGNLDSRTSFEILVLFQQAVHNLTFFQSAVSDCCKYCIPVTESVLFLNDLLILRLDDIRQINPLALTVSTDQILSADNIIFFVFLLKP